MCESFIAVISLAAAEKHLRAFLCGHTLLSAHTHTERDEDLQALKRGKMNVRENIILLCNISPVVAVEVIEPAALFHQVYGS